MVEKTEAPMSESEKEGDCDGTQSLLPAICKLPPRGGTDPPLGNKQVIIYVQTVCVLRVG